ncbi:hypothetical protein PWT90_03453 [Aphanocladium album]|nr:hypothetical protein PWT90_03453 [Aphanocladium album]
MRVAVCLDVVSATKWMFWRTDERRVLLMGLDCVGKTTILYRWLLGEIVTTIPTIGFNVETVKHPAGFAFTMWDVGGTTLIFLPGDVERFEEQVDMLRRSMNEDELRDVPVLVLLNMQDRLKPEEKDAVMLKTKTEYENLATSYRRRAPVKIFDYPDFSATAIENPSIVLDEVVNMLKGKQGDVPSKPHDEKSSAATPSKTSADISDVERAKTMAEADGMSASEFWTAFEDGSLAPWDHYNHLKSGFFVLIEAFEKGNSVLDAAEIFIRHLERLREGNPQRFRNTTHRTMTIFWLVQLQVAAVNYINSLPSARALQREDFKNVLLHSPQLTDGRLWREHYSKEVLFTPEAKERWCLPDLRPLPAVASTKRQRPELGPPATTADVDRLIGFALTVVKCTISSKARRGPIVKAALAALQSSTMRERIVSPAIPPYSETQAYFWVQIVHAAIATATSADTGSSGSQSWNGSVESLTLPAFKTLFGLTGDEWREHYTAKLWDSLPARMQFQPPDKKPLPNVIVLHDKSSVSAARVAMVESYAAEKEPRAEMPGAKDLAVMAAVLLQELEDGLASDHGSMLQSLFDLLYASDEMKQDANLHRKRRSLAIAKALDLSCAGADGLTQRMFWVQQVLLGLELCQGTDFGSFVRRNPYLAYEELPLVYYSPILWASHEAEEVFIAPDRRPLHSRLA